MSRFKRLAFSFFCGMTLAIVTFHSAEALALKNIYTVQKGDTLYRIAQLNNTTVENLIIDNKLKGNIIFPGQKLVIKNELSSLSENDFMLLAKLIHAEARGENFDGKIAVGAVVINRMLSNQFPSNIRDVIMQKNNSVYQFTPVSDGSIHMEPDELSIKAAKYAIAGYDPTEGALYFYNPDIASDTWIFNLPVKKRIGNHVFAGN